MSQLQNWRFCNSNGVGRLRRNKAGHGFAVDGEMEGADVNGVLKLPQQSLLYAVYQAEQGLHFWPFLSRLMTY
jgi:hypothetical protein